jgi:TetR/AcrR family transcriptional regulator, transcriptional repressor for nem operon
MADAGLTHGGFYAHFASKEELVRAALEEASDQSRERRAGWLAQGEEAGPQRLEALVRSYLRPTHRDTPELGCAAASLIAEIARHEPETRAVFAARLTELLAQFEAALPAGLPDDQRARRAIGIFGAMLGTLQMARAVTDPVLSDKILESGIEAALALAQMG